MPARILNGITIANQLKQEMKKELENRDPPHLGVILCSDDPASQLYVRKKQEACAEVGIKSTLIRPTKSPLEVIDDLNNDPTYHGILVQLPLPKSINLTPHAVFDRINPFKDVDVFSPVNVGLLLQGRPRFIPCTPQGIQHLLTRSDIRIEGKKVVIINRSDIVGKPLSALLIQDHSEANATVCLCHDRTPPTRLKEVCLAADIIVVAVGKPSFLTPDMVNERSIVIDVGINRMNGKVVGDVADGVAEKVAAITPVPGGVGPMTVTMLLRNTIKAQQLQVKLPPAAES